ncbi:MAG: hypothetical protein M0Z33_00050, partial [Actinomycetota bacterium]|nr:hypothetical protein [Actinomycetota bacterium]
MATQACAPETTPVLDTVAATRYVLGRRTASAGYSFYRTPEWGVDEPSAPDTLAAVESLRILRTEPPGAEATVAWLRGLQEDDGSYPTLTIAWAAIRALVLLGASPARPVGEYLERVSRPVLARRSSADWTSALRDAARVMELAGLGYAPLGASGSWSCAELLGAARDPRGGWASPGADVVSTAHALRIAALAGFDVLEESGSGRLLGRCEDPRVGVRLSPRSGATSAGALLAGLEIGRAGRRAPRFPGAVAASLVLMQRPDGGIGSRHRAISTLADTWDGLRVMELR